jgi:Cu(I)/Ag(I) efflux system membrane fusion protein
MHPQIVSDRPGLCPICNMRLTPVDDEGSPHDHAATAPAETSPTPATAAVPGRASFTLPQARQQLIGVRRARVGVRPLRIKIRANGTVAYDPGLFEAMVEYQQALRARSALAGSTLPEAQAGAEGLVRAATLRLRQKGASDAQLAAIARGDTAPLNLLLPGKSVWVYAQVFEYELGLIRPGQWMTITAPSLPGRRLTARVASIDPILDPATRTARVRALVPTPHGELRPESFVDVVIDVPLGERLAVPEDAVLDVGTRQIVFVVRGEGEFEPRTVELGQEASGFREVRAGVVAGEEVVVGANFLIDSESRFRAALRTFEPRSGTAEPGPAGHRH